MWELRYETVGYSIYSDKKISWLLDGHTYGWWRNKKDAENKCKVLNEYERRTENE